MLSISLGQGELDIDGGKSNLVEITGGSTWYFDNEKFYVPYLSAHVVVSDSAALAGLGNQGGFRMGAGLEFPLSSSTSFFLGGDYLVPFIDAESDAGGGVEVELEGVVGRVGFLITL